MRIDKLLKQAGYCSRGEQKQLIAKGLVRADGVLITSTRQNVDAALQVITVRGRQIIDHSQRYFMVNKSIGTVSAVTDAKYTTVIELIPPEQRVEGLYPIGRLDRDASGLVLVTNNGPLGYRMLHPQFHVEKQYHVTVNSCLTQMDCTAFAQGIQFLDGTICRPAVLQILTVTQQQSTAIVTLNEGKFHQVKKMFLSRGAKVIALKRIRFAGISLDRTLASGTSRLLYADELVQLKQFF